MNRSFLTRLRNNRDVVVGLLLAVFVLRAFVPAGYMPSAGPSLLQMCRAGFAATVLADPASPPAQGGDHASGQHCLFAAMAAAPTVQHSGFAPPQRLYARRLAAAEFPFVEQSLRRTHQARGPPVFS